MESRRQRTTRTRSVKKKAKSDSSVAAFSLPNIAELIEDGDITIGRLRPVGCVATATDEDCTYAMLVRRRDEILLQFLVRLDQAIDKALTLGTFTDEINPWPLAPASVHFIVLWTLTLPTVKTVFSGRLR